MLLVRTPQARERLIPLPAEGNRARSRVAPLVAILAADIEFHEHLPKLVPFNPNVKDWFADARRTAGQRAYGPAQLPTRIRWRPHAPRKGP